MIRKLMIMLLAAGFVGTVALAKAPKKEKRVKKELTEAQKAKRAANRKRYMERLKKDYPEDMAKFEKLMADGKKKEARKVMGEINKKRALAHLDKLAEKYPEQVEKIKKLMEDKSKEGKVDLREARKELYKQVKDARRKAKKSKKSRKAKKADNDA
jgi:hypothetical protein